MTGREADTLAGKLSIHLRRNQFAICHEILNDAEKNGSEEDDETRASIAELPIDLRWINILENAGYVYQDQLDDVDIETLKIPQLAGAGKVRLARALGREINLDRLLKKDNIGRTQRRLAEKLKLANKSTTLDEEVNRILEEEAV